MSEERFEVVQDPRVQTEYFIYDNENKISMNITDYPFDDQDVCSRVVMLLNEQQATIEMYQRRVDKREEQISIIKKHCLKFLTDEQVETIRKELENG